MTLFTGIAIGLTLALIPDIFTDLRRRHYRRLWRKTLAGMAKVERGWRPSCASCIHGTIDANASLSPVYWCSISQQTGPSRTCAWHQVVESECWGR